MAVYELRGLVCVLLIIGSFGQKMDFLGKDWFSWKIQLVLALNFHNFMSLLGVCVLNLGVLVD